MDRLQGNFNIQHLLDLQPRDEDEESIYDVFPLLAEKNHDARISLEEIDQIEELILGKDFEEVPAILNRVVRNTKAKHAHYFYNDVFFEKELIERQDLIFLEHDVDMNDRKDNWLILEPDEDGSVGTHGVATCFALMGRGQREDGSIVLYCYHYGGEGDIRDEIENMHAGFIERNCLLDSIELFAIGGQMYLPGDAMGTLKDLFKILSVANRYRFKGIEFNLAPNASISTFISKDAVVYQKDPEDPKLFLGLV